MAPKSNTKSGPSNDTKICYFLNKFPREVRDNIYKHLLVNEALSDPKTVALGRGRGYWAPVKLNLSPEILLTCRQIYEESSEILYGDNKFFACGHDHHLMTTIFDSHHERHDTYEDLSEYQTIAKVKHWIIVIDTHKKPETWGEEHPWPVTKFVWLLRAICESNVASLQILVLPYGSHDSLSEMKTGMPGNIHTKLEPLMGMLGNVKSFEIRYINEQDGPIWNFYDEYSSYQDRSPFLDWDSIDNLQRLAPMLQMNEPAVRVFKMHQRLTEYAQTFERCLLYKQQMVFSMDRNFIGSMNWTNWTGQPKSPYVQGGHPLEKGLHDATEASYFNRLDVFKQKRAIVLDYLEPQYQKIVAATLALTEFIKEKKKKGGMLDPDGYFRHDADHTIAIILIEDLANSFRREMPHSTKASIRPRQEEFELEYDFLPRQTLLTELRLKYKQVIQHYRTRSWDGPDGWFRDSNKNQGYPNGLHSFIESLKLVVKDMEAQYLEIRAARRRLFESDIKEDSECVIDVESYRCDEKIDWSVLEPDVGAAPKADPYKRFGYPFDTGDYTEDDRNVWREVEHRSEDQDEAVDMNEEVEVDDDQENNSVGVWKSVQEDTQDH
jgi:hypothetical protein